MPIGSLRRSVGALGLVSLVPVAAMLLAGTLSPVDAARRVVLSVLAVLVLGRLAAWGIAATAASIEQAGPVPVADGDVPGAEREAAVGGGPTVGEGS